MKPRKSRGIQALKERYGLIMISPWILGIIVFFIWPIIQSIIFSFSSIKIEVGKTVTDFIKLENYKEILLEDPNYLNNLASAFKSLFVSLPFILIVSIVLALLLNGKYFGRVFFRGLFFLPVIIAGGAALQLFLTASGSYGTRTAVSETATFGMIIDFNGILASLNMPASIENYISSALTNTFMLIWQSGIQTILIIAGLQSIPDLLYEVAKVEGATKWEEFWFITLPMLGRTLMLVIIFTIVDLVSSSSNQIILMGYNKMETLQYGVASAMLWFYFALVGILIAVVIFVYNRMFLRRWS